MDAPHNPTDTPNEIDDENDALEDIEEDDDLDDEDDDALDDDDDEGDEGDDDLDPTAARPPLPLVARSLALTSLLAERDRRRAAALDAQRKRREAATARKVRPKTDARPRCGARCRSGRPCVAPAVWLPGASKPRNGRCRMHGGLSTGPRTAEGRARVRAAIQASNAARAAGPHKSAAGARGTADETDGTTASP